MRVVCAVLLLGLLGCGPTTTSGGPQPESSGPGTWSRLPDVPLSPRLGPVVAAVGGSVVVVGGATGPPCPPAASCTAPPGYAADGAAYDAETGRWTRIADAPHAIEDRAPHAVAGGRLYVLSESRLLRYDATGDSWTLLSTPSGLDGAVTTDGRRLVFADSSDEDGSAPDRVLDTRTGAWSVLPDDPLGQSFDRAITPTPHGLVLTAHSIDALDAGGPALVEGALLPPGSHGWQRFPGSDQLGGGRWVWSRERLVDPSPGGADGGEVDGFGRTIPFGGRLDPATGEWSRLPGAPAANAGGWAVEALHGPLQAAAGWLYDDTVGRWHRLPRPDGAPPAPGTATWAGGDLVVVGGEDWEAPDRPEEWTAEVVYSTGSWVYRLNG